MLKNKRGSALVWAVCSTMVLMIVTAAVLSAGQAYAARSVRDNSARQAYLTARSAVDAMIVQLLEAENADEIKLVPASGRQDVVFTDLGQLPGKVEAHAERKTVGNATYALLDATAIVGHASETVNARLELIEGSGGEASLVWEHRIFSNGNMDIEGKFDITGSIHSNSGIKIGWAEVGSKIRGNAEARTFLDIHSNIKPEDCTPVYPAEYIEMPIISDYVDSFKLSESEKKPAIVMPDTYEEITGTQLAARNKWTGDIRATGDVSTDKRKEIDGNIYINGNLTIGGSPAPVCVLKGNLYVNGNITITNGAVIEGYMFATGNITTTGWSPVVDVTGNLHANGYIDFGNPVKVNGNLSAGKWIKFVGSLPGSGACCELKGNLSAGEHIDFGNPAKLEGNVSAGGYVKFVGSSPCCDLKGNLSSGDYIDFGNPAKIDGNVFAEKYIKIVSDGFLANPGGTMFVYSANGNISNFRTKGEVNGIAYAPNGNININGEVNLNGSIVGNTVSGWSGNLKMGVIPSGLEPPFMGGSGGEPKWKFVHYE